MAFDLNSIVDIALLFALVLLFAPSLGSYLARVYTNRPVFGDRLWNPVEGFLYRLFGIDPRHSMRFKEYALALLLLGAALIVWIYAMMTLQSYLPWNPGALSGFSWDLAFHTAASFATNTDFTHFTSESQLSVGGAILGLQIALFLSPAMGLAVIAAFVRGFTSRDGTLGNFYVDITRSVTRVLLPIAFVGAIVLVLLDLPQTFVSFVTAHGIGGASQTIYLGPVASWTSIELLGTNGGGWYAANAANALANPSGLSSLFETALMLLIPVSVPFMFGRMVRRPSESYPYIATILIVLFVALGLFVYFQDAGSALVNALPGISPAVNGYPVGQQAQYTLTESSAFNIVSIYANVGAQSAALGSLTSGAQMVLFFGMFTQSTPGGVGTGFGGLLIFAMVGVFLAGLMVGRTPEYLGKKVGTGQMKWSAAVLISHPAIILVPTLIAVVLGFAASAVGPLSNSLAANAHQFTILLYEFTSEAANNGSSMGPINDGTLFFNLIGAAIMLIGRFFPMLAMLAIGSLFAQQDYIPESTGTLKTTSMTFTLYLVLLVVIVSGLLFLPVLALGPLAQGGW